ncbi:MAG: acylphosphatase [Aerococcaceae bacterium]|nr:acylphosphatase [Aerococcaceae bacterium]
MNTYEIVVSGRVQGVGYRIYAMQIATEVGVTGTVRNLANGDVKLIVQADDVQLEVLQHRLQQPAHRFMRVDKLTIHPISLDKNYSDFQIVY